MSDVKRLVYGPDNVYRNSFSETQCARSVADGGRSVGFHQCQRKAIEQVGGYGWCKEHAREARRAIGETESTFTVYIAGSDYLGVFIERIDAISKTDKSITAARVANIFGHNAHSAGLIKTSGLTVGTLDECKARVHDALVKTARNYSRRAEQALKYADDALMVEDSKATAHDAQGA